MCVGTPYRNKGMGKKALLILTTYAIYSHYNSEAPNKNRTQLKSSLVDNDIFKLMDYLLIWAMRESGQPTWTNTCYFMWKYTLGAKQVTDMLSVIPELNIVAHVV